MPARLVTVPTARLERAADGTPYSPQFEDFYHSAAGGLAQARHVFLSGNALPQRWQPYDAFTIVETGFGLGVNFLATWAAWRADPDHCRRLHFVSVENHPFDRDSLSAALAPFVDIEPLARALLAIWPPPLSGFHRLHFDAGRVILTLLFGDANELLPQLVGQADAFYLDGFAPAKNPQIWSAGVVRELGRLAAPGATLATWTVAGGVRAALSAVGFNIRKAPGFASKREMLLGAREGKRAISAVERKAVIIGAGLAGTLAAERLASRGWEIDLVDARDKRSAAAVGLVRPIANLRDALNAQISRSAFLYALQHYRALQHDGYHLVWDRCGVLQLARDEDEALRFAAIARSQGYPASFLEFVDQARAAKIAARAVGGAGWWFPTGAWVSPQSLAVASLARAGPSIRLLAAREVSRIEREGVWRALDAGDRVIAEAPVLILANAAHAQELLPEARLTLSRVRGQVTYLGPDAARALAVIVSGNGYVAPLPEGGQCLGASYQHDDLDLAVREADHRANLARAESMLPGFVAGLKPEGLDGWAGFRTTVPDRLPVFGATATQGIYCATGLGSRGLLWAPLGAELIASQLEGEPLPLARDLAGALSPLRFLS